VTGKFDRDLCFEKGSAGFYNSVPALASEIVNKHHLFVLAENLLHNHTRQQPDISDDNRWSTVTHELMKSPILM